MMKKSVVLTVLCFLTLGAQAHKKKFQSARLPQCNALVDVRVETYLSTNLHDADVEVNIGINTPAQIVKDTAIVRLYDVHKRQISPTCRIPLDKLRTDPSARYQCVLELQDPILWSAEEPNLYTLDVEVDGQHSITPCGIRRLENRDGKIYVNNERTIFKGVCFHPTNASAEEKRADISEKEVCKLKRQNVNTIFTHHYAASPKLEALCEAYGLYLMGADKAEMRQYATLSAMQHDDTDRRQWGEPILLSTCGETSNRSAAQLSAYCDYITERSQRIVGMVVSDSSLTANEQLIKQVFQNVRFHLEADTLLIIENRYTQTNLNGYRLDMRLTRNGKKCGRMKSRIRQSLQPGQQYTKRLPMKQPRKVGAYKLHVTLSQPTANAWAPKGHAIASATLRLWQKD